MLMVNAARHFEARIGVYRSNPGLFWLRGSRDGKGEAPSGRRIVKNGAGNERFNQTLGRSAAFR